MRKSIFDYSNNVMFEIKFLEDVKHDQSANQSILHKV